jgi:ABC-type bacteriocin/lantibiotic exporter with double-glycine peptidase domain
LSFNVPFGKTLAIVGKTGSGKSTLTDLLLGELIPTTGSITFGNLSPEQLVLRNSGIIGLVPQEIPLFNASILENIVISGEDDIYIRENVSKMIIRVELGELVRSLPMGIDTVIGESGVTLSGGQVQRIGIARALYTSPKILILDEATSALDAGTEDLIIRMLNSLEFTVSKIIVAHRLSTIKNADQIVFLDEGKILGIGTFEQLRRKFADFDNQASLMGL